MPVHKFTLTHNIVCEDYFVDLVDIEVQIKYPNNEI